MFPRALKSLLETFSEKALGWNQGSSICTEHLRLGHLYWSCTHSVPLLGMFVPNKNAHTSTQKIHTRMLMAALFTTAPNWKSPSCPTLQWNTSTREYTTQQRGGANYTQHVWISEVMLGREARPKRQPTVWFYLCTTSKSAKLICGVSSQASDCLKGKRRKFDWQRIQGRVLGGASHTPFFD